MEKKQKSLLIGSCILAATTGALVTRYLHKEISVKKAVIQDQQKSKNDRHVKIAAGGTFHEETQQGIKYDYTYLYPNNIDDTFVIDIVLPDNYDANRRYPAVYLTDCYWRREDYGKIKNLYESGKTEEFVLVGIGYPRDYDFDQIRSRDLMLHPCEFLKFIVEGVIPYVESNYLIDSENRSFLGASCGGYFLLYSLFQNDGLTKNVFKNYIINSPVFVYNNIKLPPEGLEKYYFKRNGNILNTYVYITVGEKENNLFFKYPLKKLVTTMNKRNYQGLKLDYEVCEGLGHYDIWVPTLLEGLSRCLAK